MNDYYKYIFQSSFVFHANFSIFAKFFLSTNIHAHLWSHPCKPTCKLTIALALLGNGLVWHRNNTGILRWLPITRQHWLIPQPTAGKSYRSRRAFVIVFYLLWAQWVTDYDPLNAICDIEGFEGKSKYASGKSSDSIFVYASSMLCLLKFDYNRVSMFTTYKGNARGSQHN